MGVAMHSSVFIVPDDERSQLSESMSLVFAYVIVLCILKASVAT